MAGKLVQVARTNITTDTQFAYINGISTNDIYMVTYRNMTPSLDAKYFLSLIHI